MYKKLVGALLLAQISCMVWGLSSYAQTTDTLNITIKQAEDQFLKNNLQLIGQKYNIDNAAAQVITAKLFPNPDFSFSNGIYANDVPNAYAEQSFSVSQLFT